MDRRIFLKSVVGAALTPFLPTSPKLTLVTQVVNESNSIGDLQGLGDCPLCSAGNEPLPWQVQRIADLTGLTYYRKIDRSGYPL